MYRRILVPLDGSHLSEKVLPHAQTLAQALNAELILLRVSVNPAMEFSFSDPGIAARIIEEIDFESHKYIKAQCAKLEEQGLRAAYLVREGPVAETILAVASAMEVDLIAMSTHGRSGLQRWLLGSVAERVVRHSPVPVMLIRPHSIK